MVYRDNFTEYLQKLETLGLPKDYKLNRFPMWSWGFSTFCCDVHPVNGEKGDDSYIREEHIKNGSSIYVNVNHFNTFLKVFNKLPSSHRILLVTGLDDQGAPLDLFNGLMNANKFIKDSRLIGWYAQNYDIQDHSTRNGTLIGKMHPLPLGIDLHTFAGKGNMKSKEFMTSISTQLGEISKYETPFTKKQNRLLVSVGCSVEALSIRNNPGRNALCNFIQNRDAASPNITDVLIDTSGNRSLFWEKTKSIAFVAAPGGRGIDTHRVYEILLMKSIPVVLSSSLDRLYHNFPIAIVSSWNHAFNISHLLHLKKKILRHFGREDPFSEMVMERLSLKHWIDKIHIAKGRNEKVNKKSKKENRNAKGEEEKFTMKDG